MHKCRWLRRGKVIEYSFHFYLWKNHEKCDLFVEGKKPELVDDFKYLGAFLKGSSDDRKKLSWTGCIKRRHLWKDQGMSRIIKLLLFSSTVESILFYNSTTWTLTRLHKRALETLEKSINSCYLRLLRCALDINWKDHIPNKDVFQDLPSASTKIKERRLTFIGHCLISDQC